MKPRLEPDEDRIELRVPCKPEYVRTIRRTVSEFAASLDLAASDVEEIEIATSEAVANVIRHAYVGCAVTSPIFVKCSRSRSGFVLEVIDKGCGFDAPARGVIPDVDPDREGGLGIVLIKSFMDRVCYVSKPGIGTRIRMTKHIRNGHQRLSGAPAAAKPAVGV